jgi:hypothetical protein
MIFAEGNSKLGSNCFVVSRPVGDTCPSSCHFLGNGCYAEHTEKRFPVARTAAAKNLITDKNKIRSLILLAISQNKSIRIHERGDFGKNDKIDLEYIDNWAWACQSVLDNGLELPKIWTYTHFIKKIIIKKLAKYIKVYASVHNEEDAKKAKKLGFIVAYIDTNHKFMKKKGKKIKEGIPGFVEIAGEKTLVCPEQRKGRDLTTCTGGKTRACEWCLKGKPVAFMEH